MIDVAAECDPRTIEASLSIRGWLKEWLELRLAVAPAPPPVSALVGDKRLLGHVPKKAVKPKRDKGLCDCGAKAITRDSRWRKCYDRDRNRSTGRRGSTAFHAGVHAVNFKGVETEKLKELREQGFSYAEIGQKVGLHYSTVFGRLKVGR